MQEIKHQGLPVLVSKRERVPRKVRFRKRERKIVNFGIRKLNPQQKEALKNYSISGNKRQAGIEAGYSPSSVNKTMNRLLSRKPIVEALKRKGVTDDKIADVIAHGLNAKHPFKPKQKDWHAIDKFVKEANRLHDNYPPTKVESDERVVHVHLTMDDYEAYKNYKRLRETKEARDENSA